MKKKKRPAPRREVADEAIDREIDRELDRDGPREETPRRESDLLELAAETRALVHRLESNLRSNPERLSIASWNAAVARALKNQVAILEALARIAGIRRDAPVRAPVPADAAADSSDDLDAVGDEPLEKDDRRDGDTPPPAPRPAESITGSPARSFIEAFDNRDKSFERGLEKLNNWLGGGGGTPFQYRGARAYLNASGLQPDSVIRFEELLMTRMGFDVRVGKLVVEGLRGEVLVYEKGGGGERAEGEFTPRNLSGGRGANEE